MSFSRASNDAIMPVVRKTLFETFAQDICPVVIGFAGSLQKIFMQQLSLLHYILVVPQCVATMVSFNSLAWSTKKYFLQQHSNFNLGLNSHNTTYSHPLSTPVTWYVH